MLIEKTRPWSLPPAAAPVGDGTGLWLALLAACNITLLWGHPSLQLVLFPAAVGGGQWWRLFTFPLAHVGWYNLILDGAAFLMLWHGLQERSLGSRAVYLAGCWAGSLALPLAASDLVAAHGLCGLSGISHGLMGVTALEMMARPRENNGRALGAALLSGVALKCLWELMTGKVVLASLHLGSVGMPVVETHAGGLAGGALAFFLLALLKRHAGCDSQGEQIDRPVSAWPRDPGPDSPLTTKAGGQIPISQARPR